MAAMDGNSYLGRQNDEQNEKRKKKKFTLHTFFFLVFFFDFFVGFFLLFVGDAGCANAFVCLDLEFSLWTLL